MFKKTLALLVLLTAALAAQQQSGTPSQIRVLTDANGYLLTAGAAQTTPIGQPTVFTNARLQTDSSGNLLVVLTGGTISGAITIPVNGITTTSTDGLTLANNTAATSGVPVQQSPRFRLRSNVWNTTSVAANNINDWFIESVPISGTTPSGLLKFGSSLNGAAATYPMTLSSSGALKIYGSYVDSNNGEWAIVQSNGDGTVRFGGQKNGTGATNAIYFAAAGGDRLYYTSGTDTFNPSNNNSTTLGDAGHQWAAGYFGTVMLGGSVTSLKGIATAGWAGVPAIYGSGRSTAQTAAVATVATYTVGAADGSFEVSGNANVTTSTTHSFSINVAYTDETNTPRTLILPLVQLAGSFITGGLITNVTGAGPYESSVIHIRCKAATAITISTVGTFTTVTYNVEGIIKQTS